MQYASNLCPEIQHALCPQISYKSIMPKYASFNILPKFSVYAFISYETWLRLVVAWLSNKKKERRKKYRTNRIIKQRNRSDK